MGGVAAQRSSAVTEGAPCSCLRSWPWSLFPSLLSAVRIRLWNWAGELALPVCWWAVCRNQAGKQVLSGAGLAGSSSGEVTRGERTPGLLLLVFLGVLRAVLVS